MHGLILRLRGAIWFDTGLHPSQPQLAQRNSLFQSSECQHQLIDIKRSDAASGALEFWMMPSSACKPYSHLRADFVVVALPCAHANSCCAVKTVQPGDGTHVAPPRSFPPRSAPSAGSQERRRPAPKDFSPP